MFGDEVEEFGLAVGELNNGAHGNIHVNILRKVVLIVPQSIEQLGCALGVTNVGHLLLPSVSSNVFQVGRDIVVTHFFPAVLPIGIVLFGI